MVNKPLLRPYFWLGCLSGGRLTRHNYLPYAIPGYSISPWSISHAEAFRLTLAAADHDGSLPRDDGIRRC